MPKPDTGAGVKVFAHVLVGGGGSCTELSGVHNHESSDLFRLREHGHMASGQSQGLRAHSLGRADFLFRRDGPIV